jgi:HemY protein
MLKISVIVLVGALAVLWGMSNAQDQGRVLLEWFGWRIDSTALFALIVGMIVLGLALPVLKLAGWLIDAPDRILRFSRRQRERTAHANLALGLIAAEAGETRRAFELVEKASNVLDEPLLKPLLELRAAQSIGDRAGAERAFAAMLADKETELLGRKGLAMAALERGEDATALTHADAALRISKQAEWPFRLVYDLAARSGQWDKAIDAVEDGVKRKLMPEDAGRRTVAVLLAAKADAEEAAGRLGQAADIAEKAHRMSRNFPPAAALVARLRNAEGRGREAARIVEDAWAARPHPALARAYRDLIEDEPHEDRAQRLERLASVRPDHRESRLLQAEAALERRDFAAALAALDDARREGATSRIFLFAAAVAQSRGDPIEAQRLTGLAASAPREPDWSDLDPDGPAFLYTTEDWVRLARAWGEREELIHPRFEGGAPDSTPAVTRAATATGTGLVVVTPTSGPGPAISDPAGRPAAAG